MNDVSSFCSKNAAGWDVMVFNPDTGKWWDQLEKLKRVRKGPPLEEICHVMVVYPSNNDDDDNSSNVQNHSAALSLGEQVEIASIALVNPPTGVMEQFRMALDTLDSVMVVENIVTASSPTAMICNLWSFQDSNSNTTRSNLQLNQVIEVCGWDPILWRWNGPRLRDLYLRLRCPEMAATELHSTDSTIHDPQQYLLGLRRQFERKVASLLQNNPECELVSDYILRASPDRFLFGRILALANYGAPLHGQYLVAAPGTLLSPYQFATATNCSGAIGHVKVVNQRPEGRFSVPFGNPMITMALLPSLFPALPVREQEYMYRFDASLGSRRIWEEHLALKAAITSMFEGVPGPLRDMSIEVVRNALPKVWTALFREPPDESFLRALFHPETIEIGRLYRNLGTEQQLIPTNWKNMSRMFGLYRFVRTLPSSLLPIMEHLPVLQAVASVMKITPQCVGDIVAICKQSQVFDEQRCEAVLQSSCNALSPNSPLDRIKAAGDELTLEAKETLGMLIHFVKRDRSTLCETQMKGDTNQDWSFATSKVLIDCAMFCGEIRWVSEEDDGEDGLWTCLSCLHRWQKRGQRHAYQTRKLLHPMKMIQFTRQEYYNPNEWDEIMRATKGDIVKLGTDYYWGNCENEECGRICQAVPRHGACAETDGVPILDFPEICTLSDGSTVLLRQSLQILGDLGPSGTVRSNVLEKYFDSEEKLLYLPAPIRRRTRNCIDKSTYILPEGILCENCSVPDSAVDDYCPYCGTGFEPVFACIHYSCPRCSSHFCKACHGISGIHFQDVYDKGSHVCWRVLGNRYYYRNQGLCARCRLERPWPNSHALKSAGPVIMAEARALGEEMPLGTAIKLQSKALKIFSDNYKEGAQIFDKCSHTRNLGSGYCVCGKGVDFDQH